MKLHRLQRVGGARKQRATRHIKPVALPSLPANLVREQETGDHDHHEDDTPHAHEAIVRSPLTPTR